MWSNSLFIFILSFVLTLQMFLVDTRGRRRYILGNKKLTWSAAQTYCQEHFNDLATFRNQMESDEGSAACNGNCWIGLRRDRKDPDVWRWSDGEKRNFTTWSSIKESNNSQEKEDCVLAKSKLWVDRRCDHEREFLCYDDHWVLMKENKTWEEALETCRTIGADPSSEGEDFHHRYDLPNLHFGNFNWKARRMVRDAQTDQVWVGLRYLAGRWLWVNGEPPEDRLTFCPAPGNYCGTMSRTGDVLPGKNCLERRNFLCSAT